MSNRTIRSILENGPEMHSLPSSADLDAVAEEERIKRETAKATQVMRHARKRGEGYQKWARSGAMR